MRKLILVILVLAVIAAYLYAKQNLRIIRFVSYDPSNQTATFKINGKRTTVSSDPNQALSIGNDLSIRAEYSYDGKFQGWLLVNNDDVIFSTYYVEELSDKGIYINY